MSAAPQIFPDPDSLASHRAIAPVAPGQKKVIHSPKFRRKAQVRRIPVSPFQQKIRRLRFVAQLSSVGAGALVFLTTGIYANAFYSQQRWSQSYSQLEDLQRHERSLTLANESLKSEIAETATAPDNGLVKATPESTLFLPANPYPQGELTQFSPPSEATPKGAPSPTPHQGPQSLPLGY